MNAARTVDFFMQSRQLLSSFMRLVAGVMFAACMLMFPVKDARAMDVWEALDNVCGKVPELCGSYANYKEVANTCFKSSDELACAVSIINVASGGSVSEGKKQIDVIVSCVKSGLPIKDICKTALDAAGLPADKVNEAYGLINQCAGIGDVDDAIVCADSLLDSSIADDADLGIPSWVNSLFDIYMDLRDKDYWGLVYDVGATVACAVANYFTSVDVCAFLEDIAEVAGAVVDGAGKVVAFVGDLAQNESKNIPVSQYYSQFFAPQIENTAQIMFQAKTDIWRSAEGLRDNCYTYFKNHTVAPDHANKICDDMLTGSARDSNAFVQKGFSQMVMRRGAQYLLPNIVRDAAKAKFAQLSSQGAFKAGPLPPELAAFDPWTNGGKTLMKVPIYGLDSIYGLFAFTENPSKFVYYPVDKWQDSTVGALAHLMINAAQGLPAARPPTIAQATDLAKQKTAEAEGKANIPARAAEIMKKLEADRVAHARSSAGNSASVMAMQLKPLNDLLDACKPKKDRNTVCEPGVRALYADCVETRVAFAKSNPLVDNFDSPASKPLVKKREEMWESCLASIVGYVKSLPDYVKPTVNDNKPGSGTVINGSTLGAGVGKGISAIAGASATAAALKSCALFRGRADELLCPDRASFDACNEQIASGKGKTCRITGTQEIYSAAPAPASLAVSPVVVSSPDAVACKPFRGRADELLCADVAGFNGCKAQVDAGKLKSCRQEGSLQVYSKQHAVAGGGAMIGGGAVTGSAPGQPGGTASLSGALKGSSLSGSTGSTALGGGTAPSGNGLKPGGLGLSAPVASPSKVDEATTKTCEPFRGHKDEMLCSDARSFAACKKAVDIGQMKTCRMTGSPDVYVKR